MPGRDPKLPDAAYKAMQGVMNTLFAQTDEDGRDISQVFHDLIPKRALPDYYKVIKHPQAMNPVQTSVKKRNYSTFAAFVKDCAQIFFNAKFYNTSSSQIYEDAVTLENVLESELRKLKNQGIISEQDTKLPDFGPLPPPSPAGPQGTPEPEDSAGDDDDDEEEEEDNKRRTRRKRILKREATLDDDDEGGKKETEQRRKRGRPPRVDTPMECRIKNIMKGLRKCKDEDGHLRVNDFEKLPDAKQYPDYYEEIKIPIALDNIRKRIKRREYKSVEQFEADVRLMCENAKKYNDDGSRIFNDAIAILDELGSLAEAEKARNDSEFRGGGGELRSGQGKEKQMKISLKSIQHNGESYATGDWVHIVNANDLSKPTVAQIYRTWEDPEGQKWINVCWYYRPEQTVHAHDRKFYEHEVVKTSQYRDHQIEEVVGKCFVMFFTRYSRGRPKGIGHRQVYVCESRYNVVEKHFNKIKTWKSCIPDEVRGQDYEIDAFEKQETLRKFPSPIAHLLPPNATEDDPLPDAKMGADNAPPIVGAVFKRRKGSNDSPPPEATPPPQPSVPAHQPPAPAAKSKPAKAGTPSSDYHENLSMTQMYKQAASLTPAPQTPVSATPTPQILHRAHMMQTPMAPQYSQGHNTPLMRQGSVHQQYTPGPVQPPPSPHMYPQQQHHHISQPHLQAPPQMYPNPQHYAHQAPMQPQVMHQPMPHHPGVYASPQVQHSQYAPPHAPHMQQPYPQQYPTHHHHQPLPQYTPQMAHQHRAPTQTPMPQPPPPHPNAYYPPQVPPSTYTLPESTTSGIPESIAEQFLRDEEGRILWFTVPPLETPAATAATQATVAAASSVKAGPSHSLEYLARRNELLAKKRKRREEREKELRQAKRQKEIEKKKELKTVRDALGNALKALGGQLRL